MDVKQISGDLKTSCLAPLFLDLDNPKIVEKDEATAVELKLKSPLPEDEARLIIVDHKGVVRIFIPRLIESKDYNVLARCGDVNHQTCIPKLCWDPEDGEVTVEWSLIKGKGQTLNSELVEYVIALVIRVFAHEKVAFTFHTAKNAGVPEVIMKQLIEQCKKSLEEDFSCLEEVVSG